MPYRWEEILQDWLMGAVVDYDPSEIVDAFNLVEKTMGSNWIDLAFGQSRGSMVAIPIIELGLTLREVERIPNASRLITEIRENYPRTIYQGNAERKSSSRMLVQLVPSDSLHELAHAIQVSRIAAHYKRHSFEVELEPELVLKSKRRHPDLRVKSNGKWVYVEVVCPGFSKEAQNINKILYRISKVKDEIPLDRVVEIYLYKDPSETEVNQIIETCKFMAQKDSQPQELNIEGIAQIFTNPWNQERLPTFRSAIEEKRPILGIVGFEMKNDQGVIHGKKCNATMPFTDERAQRILNEKTKQLSRNDSGMVVIDVSSVPGGLKRWPELIARRLQPNLNRRISGVLITESSITGASMKTEKKLVKHPNPIHSLPEDFLKVTCSAT